MSFFSGIVDNVKHHRRAWITGGVVAVVVIVGGMGFWNWHSQPQFCAICHPMDSYYESFISSGYMANLHGQSEVECLDCHEPTISQQVTELWSFITGDYENPLPEMEYATEDCLGCHMDNSSHKSWEEVIALTEDYQERTDFNPHNPPEAPWHLTDPDCQVCHKSHKVSMLYCSSCHEDKTLPEGWEVGTTPPGVVLEWDPQGSCTVCHQMAPYVESMEDPELLAYTHAQAGISCNDYECHNDMGELTQKHEAVLADPDNWRYQPPLFPAKISQEVCMGCHLDTCPHNSWEELAALTEDYTMAGELHNPHDAHVNLTDDQWDCYNCHGMHEGAALPTEEDVQGYCFGCHHAEVLTPCSECHE